MDYLIGFYIMVMLQPMTLATGYFIGDPIWRCKLLNKMSRGKFFGIVILDGWGNNAMMMVKDLRKDLLSIGDDVYAIQDRMIINLKKPTLEKIKLYQKHPEAMFIKEEKLEIKTIKDSDIRVIGGVPFIELDKNDMIPVEKSVMKLDQKYKNMLPGKVGATLKTEVAVARAKAYNEQGEQMKKLLMIIAIIAVAAVGFGVLNYWNAGNTGNLINTIANQTAEIKAVLAAMNQSVVG